MGQTSYAGITRIRCKVVKTSAALMVDYSCALKLTSSISVLAAMSLSIRLLAMQGCV